MDFATFEKIAAANVSEEGVSARFYDRAVKTGRLNADGLPQFEMRCFCEIRIKDNNSEVYDQPATEDKIRRFPKEYACYLQAKKEEEKGTPLQQFAFLNAAEIESLKLHGIFTVETLSELSDEHAQTLGLEQEKALAVKFVERAKGNLTLAQWQQKEEEYLHKIRLLESKIEDMRQQLKGRNGNEKYIRNMSRRG